MKSVTPLARTVAPRCGSPGFHPNGCAVEGRSQEQIPNPDSVVVEKRSVVVRGRKTSVSLEGVFWLQLKAIAQERHITLTALISEIDKARVSKNLSSILRVFVLECCLQARVSLQAAVTRL